MGKKKKRIVLCDTNILFGILKKDQSINLQIQHIGLSNISFCLISQAEAYLGCNKQEFKVVKQLFSLFPIYGFGDNSDKIFTQLIHEYYHVRHSKWIPDALIASIAIVNGLELYTQNRSDFDFIPELTLYSPI